MLENVNQNLPILAGNRAFLWRVKFKTRHCLSTGVVVFTNNLNYYSNEVQFQKCLGKLKLL